MDNNLRSLCYENLRSFINMNSYHHANLRSHSCKRQHCYAVCYIYGNNKSLQITNCAHSAYVSGTLLRSKYGRINCVFAEGQNIISCMWWQTTSCVCWIIQQPIYLTKNYCCSDHEVRWNFIGLFLQLWNWIWSIYRGNNFYVHITFLHIKSVFCLEHLTSLTWKVLVKPLMSTFVLRSWTWHNNNKF